MGLTQTSSIMGNRISRVDRGLSELSDKFDKFASSSGTQLTSIASEVKQKTDSVLRDVTIQVIAFLANFGTMTTKGIVFIAPFTMQVTFFIYYYYYFNGHISNITTNCHGVLGRCYHYREYPSLVQIDVQGGPNVFDLYPCYGH